MTTRRLAPVLALAVFLGGAPTLAFANGAPAQAAPHGFWQKTMVGRFLQKNFGTRDSVKQALAYSKADRKAGSLTAAAVALNSGQAVQPGEAKLNFVERLKIKMASRKTSRVARAELSERSRNGDVAGNYDAIDSMMELRQGGHIGGLGKWRQDRAIYGGFLKSGSVRNARLAARDEMNAAKKNPNGDMREIQVARENLNYAGHVAKAGEFDRGVARSERKFVKEAWSAAKVRAKAGDVNGAYLASTAALQAPAAGPETVEKVGKANDLLRRAEVNAAHNALRDGERQLAADYLASAKEVTPSKAPGLFQRLRETVLTWRLGAEVKMVEAQRALAAQQAAAQQAAAQTPAAIGAQKRALWNQARKTKGSMADKRAAYDALLQANGFAPKTAAAPVVEENVAAPSAPAADDKLEMNRKLGAEKLALWHQAQKTVGTKAEKRAAYDALLQANGFAPKTVASN